MTDARRDRLASLQAAYGAQLPERLAALRTQYAQLCVEPEPERLKTLHRLTHSLAGSAGTFGYHRLSAQAHLLELQLVQLLQRSEPLDIDALAPLAGLFDTLAEAAQERAPLADEPLPASPATPAERRPLVIIEDDTLLAEQIAAQLGIYGWQARLFHNVHDARQALATLQPSALIVDITLPEGRLAGTELLCQLRAFSPAPAPTIVISSHWDWPSRLSAARAGADAYLVKPLDFALLNEKLDSLCRTTDARASQIVLVEDEDLLRHHYGDVLQAAGMQVTALADPADLLATLDRLSPDLVLLDLYLGDCLGTEVARVIRQDPKFTDLPIVFLSTESGQRVQLLALQTGADDFLTKPVDDLVLVNAVRARVARFRALRELTRQDRMTGLLNHIAFHLQLEFELGRNQRTAAPLSVAILDIDKFKAVNDTYGHPVGDLVIRALARLLKQRLRRTDILGRLGGEEFGIIMTDTPPETAVTVLDELRREFGRLRHVAGTVEFHCSFSAGVAGLHRDATVDSLLQAADAALYQSKQQGRNRVTLHVFPALPTSADLEPCDHGPA